MNEELWPLSREALARMVAWAKKQPTLSDCSQVIDMLNYQFRGINNPEAFAMIDSITSHFKEEANRKAAEEAVAYAENLLKKHFDMPEINATDEQIAAAITKIAISETMQSKRDWGGIYRILVDSCKWPPAYKDFERKVKRLEEMGLLNGVPQEKAFDYQGLQTGISMEWPDSYKKWLSKTSGDNRFEHRRDVAILFLKYLQIEAARPSDY